MLYILIDTEGHPLKNVYGNIIAYDTHEQAELAIQYSGCKCKICVYHQYKEFNSNEY